MKFAIFILTVLTFSSCRRPMPADYIRSASAPLFGEVVRDVEIDKYLDSAKVPVASRFYPLVDSLPHRTIFFPTGLLFKGKNSFINIRLCNAHYKNIAHTIYFYDSPKNIIKSYTLKDELKAINDVDINKLPDTDYYLIFYWSLSKDNLNYRHFIKLQESLKRDDLSLTILYVNVDNRVQYNLSKESFKIFLKNNRSETFNVDASRWF